MTYIEFIKENLKVLSAEQKALRKFTYQIKIEETKNEIFNFIEINRNIINYLHIQLEKIYDIKKSNHRKINITTSTQYYSENYYKKFGEIKQKSYFLWFTNYNTRFTISTYRTSGVIICDKVSLDELIIDYINLETELILKNKTVEQFYIDYKIAKEKNDISEDKIMDKYSPKIEAVRKQRDLEISNLRHQRENEVKTSSEYIDKIKKEALLNDKESKKSKSFDNYIQKYIQNRLRSNKIIRIFDENIEE